MNRKQQIDRLNNMTDADIDYSDAPELPDAIWNKAERAKFFKPIKVQKTVRIDADVLNWLESEGPGYQTRLGCTACLTTTTSNSAPLAIGWCIKC